MRKVYAVCKDDYDHRPAFVTDDKDLAEILQKKIGGRGPEELPFVSSDGWYTYTGTATTSTDDVDDDKEVLDD